MKKTLAFGLFLLLLVAIFSCKNTKKTDKSNTTETSDDELMITADGTPTFNDFISYFDELDTDWNYMEYTYLTARYFSPEFASLCGFDFNENSDDALLLEPLYKKRTDNTICLIFNIIDTPNFYIEDTYLATYNLDGKFIDKMSIYASQIKIKNNILYITPIINDDAYPEYDWFYQDNGIALCMSYYPEEPEMFITIYSITKNGKIKINQAADIVEDFLSKLNPQEIAQAYDLQKNTKWGDFQHFSSPNAFGNINNVNILEMRIDSIADDKTFVYTYAEYIEKDNFNSSIKQIFTVEPVNNKLFITDMKVLSFERFARYQDTTLDILATMRLDSITDKGFHFYIYIQKKNCPCEVGEECPAGEISGYAYYQENKQYADWADDSGALVFYFDTTQNVTVTEQANIAKYRNEELSFNAVFKRKD